MNDNVYTIRNLTHRYEKGKLTLDIDFLEIKKNTLTGLIGHNGSGKSTLLKILAFLEPFEKGEILFLGQETTGQEHRLRQKVTYLLQSPYLLKRSVFDNIAYGLKIRGINSKETKTRVFDSLKRVGLAPEEFAKRPWYELSGGEAQRAALATRLALRPSVLLLDEPTSSVDHASSILVKEAALSALKEWGTTIVAATHDTAWLQAAQGKIHTEIIRLKDGKPDI